MSPSPGGRCFDLLTGPASAGSLFWNAAHLGMLVEVLDLAVLPRRGRPSGRGVTIEAHRHDPAPFVGSPDPGAQSSRRVSVLWTSTGVAMVAWSEEAAMQQVIRARPAVSLRLRGLRKLKRLASAVSHHFARRSALKDRKLVDQLAELDTKYRVASYVVTCYIFEREFFALLGPSGCGKTTRRDSRQFAAQCAPSDHGAAHSDYALCQQYSES